MTDKIQIEEKKTFRGVDEEHRLSFDVVQTAVEQASWINPAMKQATDIPAAIQAREAATLSPSGQNTRVKFFVDDVEETIDTVGISFNRYSGSGAGTLIVNTNDNDLVSKRWDRIELISHYQDSSGKQIPHMKRTLYKVVVQHESFGITVDDLVTESRYYFTTNEITAWEKINNTDEE